MSGTVATSLVRGGQRRRMLPVLRALAVCLIFGTGVSCAGEVKNIDGDGAGSTAPGVRGDRPASAGAGTGRDGESGGTPSATCDDAPDTGAAALRRLSRREYALTLQQLFQLATLPDVTAVPAEAERAGFTAHTALQTLSAQHMRAYLDVATTLVDELLKDAKRAGAVIGCELTGPDCLDDFVMRFGRLAFRRPLSPEEHASIADTARSNALDSADRYRFAIEALLVSPNFLYRPELGSGNEDLVALTAYEVATRLSFALRGHGPSAALLDMAEASNLDTLQGRGDAIRTLEGDSAFEARYLSFFEEWLGFRRVITPKAPPADWNDALLVDMQEETAALLQRFAWGGPGFLDVLTTSDTRLAPALARYYRLPEPDPDGWVQVPADHPRAGTGLLTHASLLSQKSDGDRIALRGNWLRSTFLCRHLEIPEAVAAELGERLVGLTHTEIVRERNTDTACRGCHAQIDPIGIGLERFDATGRFDPDTVVPDYGVAPGLPDAPEPGFDSVTELASKLRALPEVATCLTERTFLFVHGREPEAADRCTVQAARAAFVDSGHDYRILIHALLEAPAFGLRRTPSVEQGAEP